jgi:GxxExxY protein
MKNDDLSDSDRERLNTLTQSIIAGAMRIHQELGPGLLESAYEACLAFELTDRGLAFERQKPLPVIYRGVQVECGYRLDLLVEQAVVVELKAVDRLEPIHQAQLLSYLRLTGCRVGLLINFHVYALRQGIRRLVHGF